MKRVLRGWQHRFAGFLTLRRRLTLWVGGLLLTLGLVLVIIINTLTAIRLPQAVNVAVLMEPTPQASTLLPPATPSLDQAAVVPDEDTSVIEQVQEIAIREVRVISIIAVGVFALLGAVGAYWITQRGLRPVQHLSRLVREIGAESLGRRLALEGPPDEVKALADAFDDMLERLEQAFAQQSRFVADAAHELRTPLATLRTNLEVIYQDQDASLEDYREMAKVLDRILGRMERLMENLLLLAGGEAEVQREVTNLGVVLTEAVDEMKPLAQAHNVTLELEVTDELVVLADAPLLTRAVGNLIENGIRYNRPGGSVVVTAYREASGIVIQIKDTGIGISSDELPHIFERFYRVDRSRNRHRGGAGLGLSITAHIVQLHAGHIRVESALGVGSTFTIWLPCYENELVGGQT